MPPQKTRRPSLELSWKALEMQQKRDKLMRGHVMYIKFSLVDVLDDLNRGYKIGHLMKVRSFSNVNRSLWNGCENGIFGSFCRILVFVFGLFMIKMLLTCMSRKLKPIGKHRQGQLTFIVALSDLIVASL